MKKTMLWLVIISLLLFQTAIFAATELPERSQIAAQYKWNLNDIYTDQAAWEADFSKVDQLANEYAKYRGKLNQSATMLYDCLTLNDTIGMTFNKVYQYAKLKSDENIADNITLEMTGRAQQLGAKLDAAGSFITPEISAMTDETVKSFVNQQPKLKIYDFYFTSIARQKPHILDPKSEQLVAQLAETAASPANVYNVLSGSDIRFPTIKDEQGNEIVLSAGRYGMLMQSANREVRKNAFFAYSGAYQQYRNTMAQTLNDFVRANCINAKIHNYPSAMAAALDPNLIPVAVYDNLVTAVDNNLDVLHRYMKLRKTTLGLSELHIYDLFTPLLPSVDRQYSYEQARPLIVQALQPLGADYAKHLNTAFDSRWIDVYETMNKRSGAYSWGPYGVHPYILLNYQNKYDDVSTAAHELGHSMHSYYSNHAQPFCSSGYATFTAETASTVNEVLLADYMLQHTDDINVKASILNEILEQIRGTVFTQVMFAEFEKQIYAASEQGQVLTADFLDQTYHKLLVKYYGNEVIIDKEADGSWARIPHFYRYFYVYQYATGYSAATAFAERIQTSPQNAEIYINKFLKAGGSDSPVIILKNAGVDMTGPQPVDAVMTKFASVMDGLSSILAPEAK
ncbi:MAG: oligoendopeptidase F [Negativicutes bacterium]|jgi:oligoendopeptidase F